MIHEIWHSHFNFAGRIGLIVTILGIMFANFLFCQHLEPSQPMSPTEMFLAAQLLAIIFLFFLGLVWLTISFMIFFVLWVIKGNDVFCTVDFDDIFKAPVSVIKFLIFFIFGDWDRTIIFRRRAN